MDYFVQPGSIVRRIWGKADTVLFIFAGAAAEFALNKAVDWLYFTGRLPADPIGRLFSTVVYAQQIVFSERHTAEAAIQRIASIHAAVEKNRGDKIPDWAYRDVLFMLIHYSAASFELLERKMTSDEKEELYDVFYRVGAGMGLTALPADYQDWCLAREQHLANDLQKSNYTDDLFLQYRKHLGPARYRILVESQKLVVPGIVKQLMQLKKVAWLRPVVPVYQFFRWLKMDGLIKLILLPDTYREQIKALDIDDTEFLSRNDLPRTL